MAQKPNVLMLGTGEYTTGWVGKASSIAIGPDNRIHISYYDESNRTLRYAVGY